MSYSLSIKQVIDQYNLQPQKKFGQNFLLDDSLFAKIVSYANIQPEDTVIEIGPGPGGLTRAILNQNPKQLFSIEFDPNCVAALKETIPQNNFKVMHADAKQVDVAKLSEGPKKIIANLPYNISTVLLTNWLHQFKEFDCMVLMFQKEVAERIVAERGTKDYGRLSILSQYCAKAEKCFHISPKAFYPPPKVTSTVVKFSHHQNEQEAIETKILEKVTQAAFGQRRKMLRASLKSLGVDAEQLLKSAEIEPTLRAEQLSIQNFIELTKNYQNMF